jgi:hypothetical protein
VEEASRLVDAFGAWVRRAAAGVDPGPEELATGSAACQACPVCKAVSALREEHPETMDRLAAVAGDAATVIAGMLRTMFDGPGSKSGGSAPNAGTARTGTGAGPNSGTSGAGSPDPVETIHIS